jgi:hypothetical protein
MRRKPASEAHLRLTPAGSSIIEESMYVRKEELQKMAEKPSQGFVTSYPE